MRRLTIGTFLVAALLALVAGSYTLLQGGSDNAEAVSPAGPVSFVGIDTDITGNSANALGVKDSCIAVGNGAPVVLDIVVMDVPIFTDDGDGLAGTGPDFGGLGSFDWIVNYDETLMTVNSPTSTSVDMVGQMLDFNANSGPLIPTVELAASANSDGTLSVANSDFSSDTGSVEDGDGVMASISFTSHATNDGTFSVFLSPGALLLVVDGGNNSYTILDADDAAGEVIVKVDDGPCPAATDLSITQTVTSPPSINVSNNALVDVDLTVTNNGPDTIVTADVTTTVTPGPGCTATPAVFTQPVAFVAAPQSIPLTADFLLHCTQPSSHPFTVTSTITRTGLGVPADLNPADNTDTDAAIPLVVIATSDITVTGMAISGTGLIVDNSVDDDGDTQVDEDPLDGVDQDGNNGDGEDGGTVLPVNITKNVNNLGPYGPTAVLDALLVVQGNPIADECGISLSPLGPFTQGPLTPSQQLNIASGGSVPVSYTIYLHCGPSGYGFDDDGDCVDSGVPLDGVCDSHIDEDYPPPSAPGDQDGDTLVDEDGPVALPTIVANDCAVSKDPHIVDPNPQNSTLPGFNNPFTGNASWDGCAFLTKTLTGTLPFTPTGEVIIDEVAANVFSAPIDNDCLVTVPCKLQLHYNVPGGDVCILADGSPNPACTNPSQDVQDHHTAGSAENMGGQPLAGVSLVEGAYAPLFPGAIATPGAFVLTNGALIPDGEITTNIQAGITLRAIPGNACTTAGLLSFDLSDGDLPGGGNDNMPTPQLALVNPLSWSTKLDAVVNYIDLSVDSVLNGYPYLWQRNVGFTIISTSIIQINELVFGMDPTPGVDESGNGNTFDDGPWLRFAALLDPDFDLDGIYDEIDPDNDNDGTLDQQDPDNDNDGVPNSIELAQCTPLDVTQISLGESIGGSFTPIPGVATTPSATGPTPAAGPGESGPDCGNAADDDGDGVADDGCALTAVGGTVLRTCEKIKPLGAGGHTDLIRATRADLGTTTNIPAQVGCSGENDAVASICKDETPGDQSFPGPCPDTLQPGIDNDADTSVDEDPTLDGIDQDGDGIDGEDPIVDIVKASEEQHINVEFDVDNGAVPGDLEAQFGIVGPSVCNPHWIGQAGDTVVTNTLGAVQTSTITRTDSYAANEIKYFVRKYSVTCPPGSHNFNIFNNVSSTSGLPDPDLNNNQAENELQIIATADVDDDGIANPLDSCNWVENDGVDTDGDGIDNACDVDDDGDDIPDVDDDCPTIPEDDDDVQDDDGCPDTDVTVDVEKDEDFEVDVSQDVVKNVVITVTNGNYPANVLTHIVAVSVLGGCEVRLTPQAGDSYSEFTTDELPVLPNPDGVHDTLWSEIERTDFFNAGETKIFNRSYTIHCGQNSSHSFELAVDSLPLNPVQEEDLDDNVHKNFPTVTAYNLADLKKVSLTFNNPPASVKVGQSFNLQVLGTIHNNGPTNNVDYTDTLTIGIPADCSIDGGPLGQGAVIDLSGLDIDVSENIPLNQMINNIVCNEQSFHDFTAHNEIETDTLHVRDANDANNEIATLATVVVNADADLTVSNVVTSGGPGNVNVPFNVTVTGDLGNNGPEDPVNADATFSLSVPGDCTKVPAGNQTLNNVALGTLLAQAKVWSVTCTNNSDHTFTGAISVVADQLHVIDPDTGNNSGNDGHTLSIFRNLEKTICDVYVGPAPVPPAATSGAATSCPGSDPWNGGPGVVSVSGLSVNVVSDDLDYSSQPVTIKRSLEMDGIAGGPQICTTSPDVAGPTADQVFTEAEPQGTSTAGTVANWTINLPLPTHDGEPNWCVVEYTVTKEIDELHVGDITPGDLTMTVQFIVARDTDGDGVFDNALGDLDNCKLDPNPGQEDSNGNGTGDECDNDHDVMEKYITVLGPAAINLSDDNGRYMWVIGEMGNASDVVEQVQITINIVATPPLPADCDMDVDLILPGQDTFLMLAHEQKFQVFRVRFECHAPATQQVITLDIEKCIELLSSATHDDDLDGDVDEDSRDGVDDDGDSEDGEDPPNPDDNPGNDCQDESKQIIIDQP